MLGSFLEIGKAAIDVFKGSDEGPTCVAATQSVEVSSAATINNSPTVAVRAAPAGRQGVASPELVLGVVAVVGILGVVAVTAFVLTRHGPPPVA